MTRSERVQELRNRMGDHSQPAAFESMVDNGDGTLTVTEVTDDGITQHRATWMPSFTNEDDGQ